MQQHLQPDALGRALRQGSSSFLKRRRSVIKLTFFSCAVLGGTAPYQMGILRKLPGPGWRGFDAEKVNGSAQAYSILATPDALLGLASYAVTACLAARGSENRWRTHPWMPLGMGLKMLSDAILAGKLTLDECAKFRSFSLWSLLVAGATFTALPLAIPETKRLFAGLRGESMPESQALFRSGIRPSPASNYEDANWRKVKNALDEFHRYLGLHAFDERRGESPALELSGFYHDAIHEQLLALEMVLASRPL